MDNKKNNSNKIILRHEKNPKKVLTLITGIVWFMAVVWVLVEIFTNYNVFSIDKKLSLIREGTVYFAICYVCVLSFYTANKDENKIETFKKKGKMYVGSVVHIRPRQIQNTSEYSKELLIEFYKAGEKKYIVDYNFPYELDIDVKKYTKPIHEDIFIKQYNIEDTPYIVFDKTKTKKKYKYRRFVGAAERNFDKNISCKIYELNGKYLIDEYIGEDIKCEENLMFDDATNNDLNYDFNKAMASVVIEVYVLFFSILYILSVMRWRR